MNERIDFRAPKKHKEMMKSIARNKGVKDADVYREAIEQYLSSYSTIPTLKELWNQVERHEKRLNEIEKVVFK